MFVAGGYGADGKLLGDLFTIDLLGMNWIEIEVGYGSLALGLFVDIFHLASFVAG